MGQHNAIRVISFNVLVDRRDDPPYSWTSRRSDVMSLLRRHQPDIICIQEALEGQKMDLLAMLPEYDAYGVGRDDGCEMGEQVPVFHKRALFDLAEQGHFWLSQTPDVPGSIGWDAKRPRTVTWKRIIHKQSGQALLVANTHYDHVGGEANRNSIKVIRDLLPPVEHDQPMLLCGDFNSSEQSPAYRSIIQAGFHDAALYPGVDINGPAFTYHRFMMDRYGHEAESIMQSHDRVFRVIDHIFYRGNIGILHYQHLDDHVGGLYPSDHFPVLCDLVL